ncbi:MAG TPA: RagB/SusD family nutrient uptake outer membrane protein, partial [Flavobacterium sp.]|nr:RagB/SusD family nutrient uptake outer membrane protein [Flavobacterium sp.]
MKNRVTIKPFLFAALLSLASASCEQDLDVDSQDRVSESDFLNNPDNAVRLVNGVYNKMLDFNMYSFSWIGMTSITSDDADKGSIVGDTGTDKDKLDALNFDSSLISFNDVWKGRYDGIYRANNALFFLEKVTIDPALKNRLIGEVKFLRALYYFDLVRCYGGVPLVTERTQNVSDTNAILQAVYGRKTKAETYAFIETELTDAINRLPLKTTYGPNDLGRATKQAAQGLLAKAYLYEEKWQDAFNSAGDVMASGQYSLLADYASVWREVGENGTESVFEVQAVMDNGLVD